MMKRILLCGLIILIIPSLLDGQILYFGLYTTSFSPADQTFQNIYGGGFMFGGELELAVWKGLSLYTGGKYFGKTGHLSFTQEKTELRIIPIDFGARYKIYSKAISPYIGAGIVLNNFREDNPIGPVNVTEIGFRGEVGIKIKTIYRMLLDFQLDYCYSRINPADIPVNIGGLGISTGLIVDFGKISLRGKNAKSPWYEDFFKKYKK